LICVPCAPFNDFFGNKSNILKLNKVASYDESIGQVFLLLWIFINGSLPTLTFSFNSFNQGAQPLLFCTGCAKLL